MQSPFSNSVSNSNTLEFLLLNEQFPDNTLNNSPTLTQLARHL
uniref:Uncharacterized protein n=1 Tax=Rhizophora mucronata TaxID=61149 RepID=A0A2P2Q7S8_RHIMU